MKLRKKSFVLSTIFSASIVSLFLPEVALAFIATHQVRPNSSFESTALSNSCSTMADLNSATQCNPALFATSDNQGISLSLAGKSDGDSVDNGRDLIFKPITEDMIRRLFQERNFNSFTLNTDLVFKTNLFELSYSPYYLLADIFIYNPAFPEISLNLVNRETLRITTGGTLFQEGPRRLNWGISPYYYKHEHDNTNFTLLDLSRARAGDLITFETTSGLSGDAGLFFEDKSWPISRFSMQARNIGSKVITKKEYISSYFRQTNRFLFEPYASAGVGKSFITGVGGFDLNVETFFDGYFQAFQPKFTTLSGRYSLKLFSLLGAYSSRYQNLGLRFDSQYFNVGLFYGREVDIGTYQDNPERSIYTGIGVSL